MTDIMPKTRYRLRLNDVFYMDDVEYTFLKCYIVAELRAEKPARVAYKYFKKTGTQKWIYVIITENEFWKKMDKGEFRTKCIVE